MATPPALRKLAAFLNAVPPVAHAFAYGSAVFHQPGLYSGRSAAMVDFMLVVRDATAWHAQVRRPVHR